MALHLCTWFWLHPSLPGALARRTFLSIRSTRGERLHIYNGVVYSRLEGQTVCALYCSWSTYWGPPSSLRFFGTSLMVLALHWLLRWLHYLWQAGRTRCCGYTNGMELPCLPRPPVTCSDVTTGCAPTHVVETAKSRHARHRKLFLTGKCGQKPKK